MAAYIPVPRDLTRVKSKVFFNLTKRQLVCFGAAALIGVPSFFLLKRTGNVSLAALGMIIIMLPLFFLAIEFYLISNGYVDMKRKVTDKYRTDVKMGTVASLPEEIQPMAEGIHTLIQSVYDDTVLKDMFTDGHETKVKDIERVNVSDSQHIEIVWKFDDLFTAA